MKWSLLFLLLLFCEPSLAQEKRKVLQYQGIERSYYLHSPRNWNGKTPLPLVILLHGGGGNAQQALKTYPLAPVADREGFLLVAPNGTGPIRREILRTWNVGWGFGYAQRNHIDDAGFVRALILQLAKDYPVDRARVYLTGLSNGAILCHSAAAANSDLVAGIAPVVGCAGGGESAKLTFPQTPQRALNVILFNGGLDRHIPLKGGLQELHAEDQARYVCSAQESARFWVNANGCNPTPQVEELPEQKATRYTWTGGRHSTQVVLWVLHNQGHAWPGGKAPRASSDQCTTLVKAHEVLWQFFQQTEAK